MWAVVGLGALLAPLPYVDADGLLPMLQALLPVAGLVGLVVVVLTLLARMRLAALVAAVASLALLWPVLPLSSRPEPAPGAAPVRVMSLNVEFGQADPAAVVAAVREHRVDALVLLEMTPQHWAALSRAGLTQVLPHATGTTRPDAGGTVVAARRPLTCPGARPGAEAACPSVRSTPSGDIDGLGVGDDPFDQVTARLADGTLVRGAHPFPPSPTLGMSWWRDGLGRLGQWARDHAGEPRLVVAGDLNAGDVHPLFREVTTGLTRGPRGALPWTRTWPLEYPVPPFVQIDHVLSRGFAVTDEGVLTVPGTDHAAVWAELTPARAG